MKIHLHSEQFDGAWHAECGAMDEDIASGRIVGERAFEKLPKAKRCRKCAKSHWPWGGEPE
jgi:hypothetical protein